MSRTFAWIALGFALVLAWPASSAADILVTAAPTSTYKSTDSQGDDDIWDLDHHFMFAWKIPNVDLKGGALVDAGGNVVAGAGATITFKKMYNWDSNPNDLFLHLLDDSKSNLGGTWGSTASGTVAAGGGFLSWYTDDTSNIVTSLNDNFVSNPTWLAPAGTADTKLDQQSFPGLGGSPINGSNPGPDKTGFAVLPASGTLTGGTWYYNQYSVSGTSYYDYTYVFTNSQVQALASYIAPGSAGGGAVAIGFDPDCHYYNDSVAFNVFTGTLPPPAIPEPSTLVLMGSGLLMAAKRYRRKSTRNS